MLNEQATMAVDAFVSDLPPIGGRAYMSDLCDDETVLVRTASHLITIWVIPMVAETSKHPARVTLSLCGAGYLAVSCITHAGKRIYGGGDEAHAFANDLLIDIARRHLDHFDPRVHARRFAQMLRNMADTFDGAEARGPRYLREIAETAVTEVMRLAAEAGVGGDSIHSPGIEPSKAAR